jgi:hypothetical protein
MDKIFLSLFLVVILSLPVSAGGVYHNNTVYNLENVIKVTKFNSTTIKMYYRGGGQDTIKFKNKLESKKFFDAVNVIIL